MSRTKTQTDLTEGNIVKGILLFAAPILVGNVFQQLYNVVDTAVIGNVLGDNALAAIGAASPVYSLIVGFASGITSGFSVIISRLFGAKDRAEMKKAVSLTYVLTFIIALVMTSLGIIFTNPILKLLKTPDSIMADGAQYLIIIFSCSVFALLYNMAAGLLRAVGNSRTPLYFLVFSSIVNVVLDILFVKYLGWGIAGAAYATVLSELLSVVLAFVYIGRKIEMIRFSKGSLQFDKAMIKELLSMGFSMGLMYVVVSIGSVALQSTVNTFGDKIITAHTAARRVDDIFMLTLDSLSSAGATFVSQNYGAKKTERIKKGIKASLMMTTVWSIVSAMMIFVFGRLMIIGISGTHNEYIIENAQRYIRINISFFAVLGLLLIMRTSLQGIGRKAIPVLGSVIELILKFAGVFVITEQVGYIGVCVLEPMIWILSAILVTFDFLKQIIKINGEEISRK